MLNEIFKGMDNAAEQINENFQNIVASGQNENGHYIRFDNGIQICWQTYLGTQQATGSATGVLFQSGGSDWTFPMPFISAPKLEVGVRRTSGGTAWGGHSGTVNETEATALRIISTTNNTLGVLQPLAIGRWK